MPGVFIMINSDLGYRMIKMIILVPMVLLHIYQFFMAKDPLGSRLFALQPAEAGLRQWEAFTPARIGRAASMLCGPSPSCVNEPL